MSCKYCKDEFCVNDKCSYVADYCPVVQNDSICKYKEEEITEQFIVDWVHKESLTALDSYLGNKSVTIDKEELENVLEKERKKWKECAELYNKSQLKNLQEKLKELEAKNCDLSKLPTTSHYHSDCCYCGILEELIEKEKNE
jgi:hypothetical protein